MDNERPENLFEQTEVRVCAHWLCLFQSKADCIVDINVIDQECSLKQEEGTIFMQIKYRFCAFVFGVACSASRLLIYRLTRWHMNKVTLKGLGWGGGEMLPTPSSSIYYYV